MNTAKFTRAKNPEETRERILGAAVAQFGAHGFRGASLRAIVKVADVNLAAANYHFGTKAKLYFEVITGYFERTREIRLSRMDDVEQFEIGPARVCALVQAYIGPHIELVIRDGHHDYGRLITQLLNDNEIIANALFEREVNKVRIPFRDKLRVCFPNASDDLLARGIGFVVSIMAQAPFDPSYRTLTNRSPLDQPVDETIRNATNFAVGGITMLLGDSTK